MIMCRYTLKNSGGMVVQVVELGAAITSVLVPDKHGDFDDVTAGFDTVAGLVITITIGRLTVYVLFIFLGTTQFCGEQ